MNLSFLSSNFLHVPGEFFFFFLGEVSLYKEISRNKDDEWFLRFSMSVSSGVAQRSDRVISKESSKRD